MKSKIIISIGLIFGMFIFWACEGPEGPQGPAGPEGPVLAINTIDATPFSLYPGNMATITADYIYSGNSTINFSWEATDGEFTGATNSAIVQWNAPLTFGFYTITLTISDYDNEAIGHCTIQVIGSLDDLVAYYPFNGNADDASGNGHNGNPEPSVDFSAVDRFGNNNSAIYVGSSSSYITVPESEDLNLQSHSIVAWVKRELGHNTDGFGGVFGNGYSVDHYALVACESGIKSWLNYPSGPNNGIHLYETDALADEEFHHITITYNLNIRTIWIDGVLVSELDCSDSIDYSSSDNCYIGMDFPGGNDWFAGIIDEIRIYDRALSDSEIDALYHEGGWDK